MKKIFLLLSLLLSPAIGEEFTISDLSGGMYSNASINKIPDNAAILLQNVFTDVQPIAIERNGFEKRDSTVLGDTKAVEGLWEFRDNSGNEWIISYSSNSFYRNIIGNTPTKFGLTTTVTQIPECASNLGKFMCVNGTDEAWTFDGTSTATVSGAPLGRLIVAWRNRFVISNIPNNQSTVRFSEDGDETNWTLGGNATDPFSIEIGGANDGFNVTCMWGSYLDNLIIARKRDVWAMAGFDQLDVVTRNVSDEVGCIQNGSMREFDGSLLFLSDRGMEEMRGSVITHISEPIRDLTDIIVSNTSSERSNVQTSQSDFSAGTSSTSGWTSAGIVSGAVQLSTTAAIDDFVDTIKSDFDAGTLTNLISPSVNLYLSTSSVNSERSGGSFSNSFNCTAPYYMASQVFDNTGATNWVATSYGMDLASVGSPSDGTLELWTDSSNTPGTLLKSNTVDVDDLNPTNPAFVSFTLNPPIQITTQKAWVILKHSGCDASNHIRGQFASGSIYNASSNGTAIISGSWLNAQANGHKFSTSGNIVSQSFDVGFETTTWLWRWGTLTATESLNGETISYEVQSATSSTGSFSTLDSVSNGGTISDNTPTRRFIRYKASFTTTDTSTSPVISDVTITNSSRIRPTAVFTSQVFSIGSLITSWSPVSITDNITGNASIAYQFNSTASADINDFTESAWEDIVSGGVPTIATNTYAAFRATFTITASTETAILYEFVTTWSEGGILQPLRSWNHSRRYWLSYTTATASDSRNDRILVYQRNRTWTLLNGINAASFATWRDNLYFGDSTDTGLVYKYGVGNNDNGSAIQSIVETKSYDLGNFSFQKSFRNLYLNFNGNASFTGTFDVDYYLDSSDTEISLGTMNHSRVLPTHYRKMPFPISNRLEGQEIRYRIVKNDQTDRLKLFDLTTVFDLKRRR